MTRTGGIPLVPDGFDWPECAECSRPMQFLAQVLLDDLDPGGGESAGGRGVLSVFMCQNDPGMCADWDPASGGNLALLHPRDGLTAASVPAHGETLLPEAYGVERVRMNDPDYDDACSRWAETRERPLLEVLGQLGGQPAWLQNDEAQSCPECPQPMTFVAQFEEGHDHRTAMNFGLTGRGYAFACEPCGRAAFLWQN